MKQLIITTLLISILFACVDNKDAPNLVGLIDKIGTSAGSNGDISVPGMVLKIITH